MAVTAETVTVEISAKTDQFSRDMASARQQFSAAAKSIQSDAVATGDKVEQSTKRIGEASRGSNASMLILQSTIRRTTDQIAANAPLSQILGEHLSSLAEAAELAGGSMGKFGELLAGPLGIAFSLATTAAALLIPKLLEGGETAADEAKNLAKAADGADSFGNAQGELGKILDLTTGKLKTHNQVLIETIRLQAQASILAAQDEQKKAGKAIAGYADPTIGQMATDFGGAAAVASVNPGAGLLQLMGSALQRGAQLGPLKNDLKAYTDAAQAYQTVLNDPKASPAAVQAASDKFSHSLTTTITKLDTSAKSAGKNVIEAKKQVLALGTALNDQRANQEALGVLNGGPVPDDLKPYERPKNPRRARVDHSAEQAANRDSAYQAELRQAQNADARAQASLAVTVQDRLNAELEGLRAAKADTDQRIQDQVTAKKITPAEAAILTKLNDHAETLQETLAIRKAQEETNRNQLDAQKHATDNDITLLQISAQLTTSRTERLKLEREALEKQQQERRASLTAIATDTNAPRAARDQATADLKALPGIEAGEKAQLDQRDASPGKKYLLGLSTDINDQLQDVEVNGLKHLEDGLTGVLTGTKSIKSAFHDMAGSIIADLVRIGVEREIIQPIANALFPEADAAQGASGIVKAVGSIFGGHRATGGPVQAGKVYEVGERGRELFAPAVSGTIIPNHAIQPAAMPNIMPINDTARVAQPAQGGDTHYHVSVYASNNVAPEGFARDLASAILSETDRRIAASGGAMLRATPSYLAQYQNQKK